jgi:hypothetical protein
VRRFIRTKPLGNCKFSDGTKKAGTMVMLQLLFHLKFRMLWRWVDHFTNDALAHKLRGINHGMYERYHHDVVGVNSRLDSIQAAVLNAKLPLLDQYGKARQDVNIPLHLKGKIM